MTGFVVQGHILCLKYNTILISYLLNCCIKLHLHSCYLGQKQHSCDIALAYVQFLHYVQLLHYELLQYHLYNINMRIEF